MATGTEFDGWIIAEYASAFGVSETTARNHRKKQVDTWINWCNENGYNAAYLSQKPNKLTVDIEEKTSDSESENSAPVSLVERYKLLEKTAFNQLRKTQLLLDSAINEQQFQTLRVYIGGVKDLTSTFNELCRLRQIAEVQDGRLLPMSILERYKSDFYPRLNAGIEEMKIAIANALPPDIVPEFERAWQVSYYRWKDAARAAERAINEYKEIAQEEALKSIDKRENRKEKAKEAAKQQLKNK